MSYQTGVLNENDPFKTFSIISLFVLPPNGGLPDNIMNITTPIDQLSH